MSLRTTLLSGAPSFAHLAGLSRPAPASARSEPSLSPRADDEEDMAKRLEDAERRAEEAEKRADEAEEAVKNLDEEVKRLKAERDDDPDGDGDDDEDEDEDGDDDDDREEMNGQRGKKAKSARLRERARCAAIFADAAAANNPRLAAQLAFSTSLPRSEAIAVLRVGGETRRGGLASRMAAEPSSRVGPELVNARSNDPKALADGVLSVYRTARGIQSA